MKKITIKDIIQICEGKLVCGNEETICENFCKDTREIKEADVYVGIKGDSFNGSEFYEEALKQKAKVCILEDIDIPKEVIEKYPESNIIIVRDTVKALQQLASYKRSLYDIPVIAVTGSVGKTSTKDMLASVVSQKYKVLKTQGNYNNHIRITTYITTTKGS